MHVKLSIYHQAKDLSAAVSFRSAGTLRGSSTVAQLSAHWVEKDRLLVNNGPPKSCPGFGIPLYLTTIMDLPGIVRDKPPPPKLTRYGCGHSPGVAVAELTSCYGCVAKLTTWCGCGKTHQLL